MGDDAHDEGADGSGSAGPGGRRGAGPGGPEFLLHHNRRPRRLETDAFGINDRGQIVGVYTVGTIQQQHGFLWDGSGFTTIDVPGAIWTQAEGINNRGQVVGFYNVENASTGTDQTLGYLWDGSGFTTISVPGAYVTEPSGSTTAARSWASTT